MICRRSGKMLREIYGASHLVVCRLLLDLNNCSYITSQVPWNVKFVNCQGIGPTSLLIRRNDPEETRSIKSWNHWNHWVPEMIAIARSCRLYRLVPACENAFPEDKLRMNFPAAAVIINTAVNAGLTTYHRYDPLKDPDVTRRHIINDQCDSSRTFLQSL